jgi:GNAT superfamily N-acetyltransferase
MLSLALISATTADVPELLGMVRDYHAFDHLGFDADVIRPLLAEIISRPELGRLWMIRIDGQDAGYMLLTFGFSLEFGGRNAFIDEFFIKANWRERGFGKQAMRAAQFVAQGLGLKAVHLEVTRGNRAALGLYGKMGFVDNDRFLMTHWVNPGTSG